MDTWDGLQEVVFAISSPKMAEEFASAFGDDVRVETGPGKDVDGNDEEGEDKVVAELRTKIQEMEGQIALVWNLDLKARMNVILQGLREQLKTRGSMAEGSDDSELDEEGGDDSPTIDDREVDEEIDDYDVDVSGSDGGTDEYEVLDYDEARETSSNKGSL